MGCCHFCARLSLRCPERASLRISFRKCRKECATCWAYFVFNSLRVLTRNDLSFKSFDIWAFGRHNPHPRFWHEFILGVTPWLTLSLLRSVQSKPKSVVSTTLAVVQWLVQASRKLSLQLQVVTKKRHKLHLLLLLQYLTEWLLKAWFTRTKLLVIRAV